MASNAAYETNPGNGGETHQHIPAKGPHQAAEHLTTNQGMRISDNQNSLTSGARGPTLLEDFAYREKIFHFDHERNPERIVHARGSGAHGFFEVYDSPASRPSPAAPVRSTRRATYAASPSSSTPRKAIGTWWATIFPSSSSRTRSSSPI
jgi:catalase